MLGAMLFMAQTGLIPVPPAPVVGPLLPRLSPVVSNCARSADDEIVVCGKTDPEQYRLRPIGSAPNGRPLPPMTARLGDGTVDLKATQRVLPGASAPAAMVTIKLPF